MLEARRRAYRSFVMAVIAAACSLFAYGQNRSSISGFVLGPDQKPVSQIIVELRSEYNSVLARVRTDGSGRFFFPGLGQGRYNVRALPLGTDFAEQSVEVEISGIGARGQALSDNVQKDIYLKQRKGADAVPFRNAVVYAQEVPKEAESLYKEGIADLDRDKPDTGVASLEKAVAVFPTYFVALQRLGAVKLAQGSFDEAIDIFKRAIAVNDRSFDCWYGLSYGQYAKKMYADAVVSADKAATLRPDSQEAALLLGMSQRSTKDFTGAEKSLKRAVKISEETSADAHWQLALLYGKDMNRFADAAKELEAFLALSPDAPNKESVKKLIKDFKDKAKAGS